MQQTCTTCGARSPEAESLYILIGELGWRPLWHDGSIQNPEVEWFCPPCWEHYKEKAQLFPSSGRLLAQAAAEDRRGAKKSEPPGPDKPK